MKQPILFLFLLTLSANAQWTDNGTTITTQDNVGIGLNPFGKFNVKGGSSTTAYLNGVGVYNNVGTAIRSSLSVTSDDNGRINLYNSFTDLRVLINSTGNSYFNGGNIGIGTTNPSALLDIFSTRTTDHWTLRINTNNSNWSGFWETSDDIRLLLRDNDGNIDVDLRPDGSSYFNGGNVGIGTTNPQHKLTISGGSLAIDDGGSGIPFKVWSGSSGSNNHLRIGSDIGHYGDAVVELYQNYSGGIEQNPGKLIVNGNMGIGTKNPDAKLAVNGNIHTKEVKVDLVGWPDFVFEKSYNLPTLEQVEKHIKEKAHLQNIPSAEEVEENGIRLGEMNAKLLQKIEELMLYTIQQQKEIKELKSRLEKIESK